MFKGKPEFINVKGRVEAVHPTPVWIALQLKVALPVSAACGLVHPDRLAHTHFFKSR